MSSGVGWDLVVVAVAVAMVVVAVVSGKHPEVHVKRGHKV